MNTSCKDCKEREEDCHSYCEKYKEFLKENEIIKENRKKYMINRSTIFRANKWKKVDKHR